MPTLVLNLNVRGPTQTFENACELIHGYGNSDAQVTRGVQGENMMKNTGDAVPEMVQVARCGENSAPSVEKNVQLTCAILRRGDV